MSPAAQPSEAGLYQYHSFTPHAYAFQLYPQLPLPPARLACPALLRLASCTIITVCTQSVTCTAQGSVIRGRNRQGEGSGERLAGRRQGWKQGIKQHQARRRRRKLRKVGVIGSGCQEHPLHLVSPLRRRSCRHSACLEGHRCSAAVHSCRGFRRRTLGLERLRGCGARERREAGSDVAGGNREQAEWCA